MATTNQNKLDNLIKVNTILISYLQVAVTERNFFHQYRHGGYKDNRDHYDQAVERVNNIQAQIDSNLEEIKLLSR